MAFGNMHGRARVNPRDPQGFAVCDYCGNWFNHIDLMPVMEWQGNKLVNLGFLVHRGCLDKPQEQNKTPILPTPDPAPIINPRAEYPRLALNQLGFTLFTISPAVLPGDFVDGDLTAAGDDLATAKAAVVAAVARLSSVPTPASVGDGSGVLAQAVTAQQIALANAARDWILIYNPSNVPFAVSTGTAAFTGRSSVMLGPGGALFWATAQDLGAVWKGAVTVIGYLAGAPFWLFESPAGGGQLDFSNPDNSDLIL